LATGERFEDSRRSDFLLLVEDVGDVEAAVEIVGWSSTA
jgi:hypothetical protein